MTTTKKPVREVYGSPVTTETTGKTKLHTAKISHADRLNQNGRIYPRAVLAAEVQRLQPLLAKGRLRGAVDHISELSSGNLKNNAIIWRSIEMDDDGAVFGKFEVVDDHPVGKGLTAQINSRMAVGFSTFGYGLSMPPTAKERSIYNIPDGAEAEVMCPGYELAAVDAVDDPSCVDAWLKQERRDRQSVTEGRDNPAGTVDDECDAAFDAYFKSLREDEDVEVPPALAQYGKPGAPAPERDERPADELTLAEQNDRYAQRLADAETRRLEEFETSPALEAYGAAHRRKPSAD